LSLKQGKSVKNAALALHKNMKLYHKNCTKNNTRLKNKTFKNCSPFCPLKDGKQFVHFCQVSVRWPFTAFESICTLQAV